jgi:quercetin dioxygenase-like cupin family protein
VTIAVMPLLDTLRGRAADRALLEQLADHPTEGSWMRLHSSDDLELWLIAWPPESRTDWHDHGPAAGAFAVLRGALVEHQWSGALQLTTLRAGDSRAFAAGHMHDVRNVGATPALSLHAYSPRLEIMTRYRFRGDQVDVLGVEKAGQGW